MKKFLNKRNTVRTVLTLSVLLNLFFFTLVAGHSAMAKMGGGHRGGPLHFLHKTFKSLSPEGQETIKAVFEEQKGKHKDKKEKFRNFQMEFADIIAAEQIDESKLDDLSQRKQEFMQGIHQAIKSKFRDTLGKLSWDDRKIIAEAIRSHKPGKHMKKFKSPEFRAQMKKCMEEAGLKPEDMPPPGDMPPPPEGMAPPEDMAPPPAE